MGESTDPHIIIKKTCAAGHFEKIQDAFTIPKHIEKWCKSSHIHPEGSQCQEMTGYTIQLGHDHPDVFNFFRNMDIHQFLYRNNITKIVVHRTNIVATIGKWYHLLIRQIFAMFFKAAMEIANIRCNLGYDFTIGKNLQSQNPMGARVLRSNIEDHLVTVNYSHSSFTFGTTIP